MGIKVNADQWSQKKQCVVKHKDVLSLGKLLDSYGKRAYELVEKFCIANDYDLDRLVKMFSENDEENITFLDYCKKRRDERKYEHAKKCDDVFIKFLCDWGKIVRECKLNGVKLQ